jgi:hypothetical protein
MYIKTLFLSALLFISLLRAKAQDIPNGSFELWNNYKNSNIEVPSGWVTNDALTARINPKYKGTSTLKTSEAHTGNYAVKMQVVIDHGDTANGCIYSTANVDSVILLDEGQGNTGFKYLLHATSMKGYYKFNGIAGDSAFFGITLTKWNKQTKKRDVLINTIFLVGQNSPQYIPFVVPLKYHIPNENPDTARSNRHPGPACTICSHRNYFVY